MKLYSQEIKAIIEGAKLYAEADASDPFAFNRAMSHFHNGVSGFHFDGDHKVSSHYTAEPFQETVRLPDGVRFNDGSNTYKITRYKEIKRP